MKKKSNQKGVTLVESLVAIVVMALGILGILGVQMRTLNDTQTGVRRAQAIRLISDLSERIKAHPDARGIASSYVINWDSTLSAPTTSCNIGSGFPATSCSGADIATHDLYQWIAGVRAALPLGDARVFISSSDINQLGIMIAWRENERAREGDSSADTSAFKAIFTPTATGASAVTCPTGKICHLQYISLNQRCLPYGAGLYYCMS